MARQHVTPDTPDEITQRPGTNALSLLMMGFGWGCAIIILLLAAAWVVLAIVLRPTTVQLGPYGSFDAFDAVTPTTAWAVANTSAAVTTDGGLTWKRHPLLPQDTVAGSDALSAVDGDHAWILVQHGTSMAVEVSADGGENWRRTALAGCGGASGWMDAIDSAHAWVTCFSGVNADKVLMATVDGGRTWVQRGAGLKFAAVRFSSATAGVASVNVVYAKYGNGVAVATTSDGGVNWSIDDEAVAPGADLRQGRLSLPPTLPSTGIVVLGIDYGTPGKRVLTIWTQPVGGPWTSHVLPTDRRGPIVELREGVSVPDSAHWYVSSDDDGLLESSDQGVTWSPVAVTSLTVSQLLATEFVSSTAAWAEGDTPLYPCGGFGAGSCAHEPSAQVPLLLRSQDGGRTWNSGGNPFPYPRSGQ